MLEGQSGTGTVVPEVNPAPKGWKGFLRPLLWTVVICAAVLRILTFAPQPFDSSATIRPYLYRCFALVLGHYGDPDRAQAAWNQFCLLLLVVPAGLALLNYCWTIEPRRHGFRLIRSILCSRTLLAAAIALTLLAFRFPALLGEQLNPDESQFLAAAEKLYRDPVFFRSVDCGTTGPLNVYPLMLPAVLGISPDFASARLVGILVILASLYTLYRTLRLFTTDAVARIAVLPAAYAFIVLKEADFLHYSSEHISFLLISLAIYCSARVFTRTGRYQSALAALGFLTSAAFFAKMQAVPIILALGAVSIGWVYLRRANSPWWTGIATFLIGGVPLPVFNAILCAATGVWGDFWMSYILANYRYAGVALPTFPFIAFVLDSAEIRIFIASLIGILAAFRYRCRHRAHSDDFALLIDLLLVGGLTTVATEYVLRAVAATLTSTYIKLFCVIGAAACLLMLLALRERLRLTRLHWFAIATTAALVMSVAAVYAPHRPFAHYLLLLIIPLQLAIAWPLLALSASAEKSREHRPVELSFVLTLITVALCGSVLVRAQPDELLFRDVSHPEIHVRQSDFVRCITRASSRITIWGWDALTYLGSSRVAATRDLNMVNFFLPNRDVAMFYRERFLRDMKRTPPELLIDATGPTSFVGDAGEFQSSRTGGFELFPEINSFIRANYVFAAEGYGQRYYFSHELIDRLSRLSSRKCEAGALRCVQSPGAVPTELPPIQLPQHASIDVVFTPGGKQGSYSTVFANDPGPADHLGLQLYHLANDLYQFAIGVGDRWILSRQILVPQHLPAALSFEISPKEVIVWYDGQRFETIPLPKAMAVSTAPVTLGSWIGGQRKFEGDLHLFEVRDLGSR